MAIDPSWFQVPDIGGNALAAFERGQQIGRQRKAEQAYATYATNPDDPNALNALAQFDPKFVMGQKQQQAELQRKAQDDQRKAMLEGVEKIGQAALWADTPEKWDRAVDYLSQFYPDIAKQKGKFTPELRMSAIASAGEMKTKLEQEKGVTVGPGSHLVDPVTGKPKFSAPFAPRPVTLSEGQTAFNYDPNNSGKMTVEALRPLFVAQESGGDYSAVNSETGAMGKYQIMPQTGQGLASRLGVAWRPDLMTGNTPEAQQYQDYLGTAMIQDVIDQSGGDPQTAFSLYYGGPDRSKWGPKTRQYTAEMMARLGNGSAPVIARGNPKQDKPKDAPSGYRWKQDGTLEPIPGGPAADKAPGATPAYSQSAIDAFNRAIDSGNRLLKHPGFSTAVGAKGVTGGLLGGWVIPGTDAADFRAELDAMKAQVFLPMVQSMKGMGALSNAEGEKLTAAIGALDPKMSESGFAASLNRIIADLKSYRDRGTPKPAQQAAPARQAVKPAAKKPTVSNW